MKNLKHLAAVSCFAVTAAVPSFAAESFDAWVGVASDYVHRGISQSLEDPAIQAGAKYQFGNGWYARGFVSQVDGYLGDNEIEMAGGFVGRFNDTWGYTAEVNLSSFTGQEGVDSDYVEANFTVDYKEMLSISAIYSDDYFNSDANLFGIEGRFNLPLHDVIKTAVYTGYYSREGNAPDYAMIGFDAWTNIGDIQFKLSYTDTDIDQDDTADSRLFFTASYHF